MTRVVFEDTHEEPLAGYNTFRVEDDFGDLLLEAHIAPDVVGDLSEVFQDPETWAELSEVAAAYRDLFDGREDL